MLNLVGNSCISSYITRDCISQPFINPFTWCILEFNSCYNLVKYWDEIDFSRFKLTADNQWRFSLIVNDLVTIQYVHYHFDAKCETPTILNNDVYSSKIWEYITNKYVTRVNRMTKYNIPPIFIFGTANNGLDRHQPFTETQQKMIAELKSPYKIIFSFKTNVELKADNIYIIPQLEQFTDNGIAISTYIFNKCSTIGCLN